MYSLYFSFICLIFTTVFVFPQSDGRSTEVSVHDGTCPSSEVVEEIGRGIVCQPRGTIVKLEPERGLTYLPPAVNVSQCGGYTTGGFICEPKNETSIRIKRIPVRIMTSIGSKIECRVVEVEEHIECKQACSIKEADCKNGQSYNESSCECECKDKMQQMECNKLAGKMWDDEKCQCICQKEQECATGMAWSDELCKCTAQRW